MDFDIKRVYSAVNAEEVKLGSKVVVAQALSDLKQRVKDDVFDILVGVREENCCDRFLAQSNTVVFNLCYLVSEPEEKKLKWTDLKIGDVVRRGDEKCLVTGIHTGGSLTKVHHVTCGSCRISDEELKEWEKVDNESC